MNRTSRREKLEAMLTTTPDDQLLRYMLALELEKAHEHVKSLDLLQSLMHDAPPYVPAFLMAGQQLSGLGRNDDAAAAWRNGITEAQRQGNSHAAGEMSQFLAALQNPP